MLRGLIGRGSKDATGINPPVPIRVKDPQGSWQRSFNIFIRGKTFYSVFGIYDISNRRFPWHDEMFSENADHESIFKNAGRKNSEINNAGRQNSEVLLKRFPPTRQTSIWKISMICLTIVHYKKWCCVIHMIHRLVQIIQQNNTVYFIQHKIWHIITCHWYIHTIW